MKPRREGVERTLTLARRLARMRREAHPFRRYWIERFGHFWAVWSQPREAEG
jgi:hypothetical protein